jgi:hypothetical protein
MSSSDNILDKFRASIVDDEWVRFNFDYLRDYFKNRDSHLAAVVTILEAVVLNANADAAHKEEVLTKNRDDIHKTDKELMEFKDKGVREIIKEYLEGKN